MVVFMLNWSVHQIAALSQSENKILHIFISCKKYIFSIKKEIYRKNAAAE